MHARPVGRARCPLGKPHVGICTTQAETDPRLGSLGVRLLEMGFSAPKVIAELRASDSAIEHRQLAVVDRDGRAAAHTGTANRDSAGHVIGDSYVVRGITWSGSVLWQPSRRTRIVGARSWRSDWCAPWRPAAMPVASTRVSTQLRCWSSFETNSRITTSVWMSTRSRQVSYAGSSGNCDR